MSDATPEHKARLRQNEDAILAGLAELDAAEEAGTAVDTTLETETVEVPPYGGRPGFKFEIRRLEPETYERLTKAHTKATKPGEAATFRRHDYLCEVIYLATTDAFQKALWDSSNRRQRYKALLATDLVRKLIPKPGWREAICNKVDELGGYGLGNHVTFGSSALIQADQELLDTLGN